MRLGRRTAEGGCPHMVCGAALGLPMMLQPLSSTRAKALAFTCFNGTAGACPTQNDCSLVTCPRERLDGIGK
jgi:hypothetical protein